MADIHAFPKADRPETLKSGGGGPTDIGMEQRVAKLEAGMDKALDRLNNIETTLARIDAKLDSKIDYKWLTIYIMGILAVVLRSEIAALFA